MRLPAPLLRLNPRVHKNDFGHILILGGSPRMLGASALCGLAAMRTGAGLVTLGVPESLNTTLQKKISSVLMTWPLKETRRHTIAEQAFSQLKGSLSRFDVIALGPGLSQEPGTIKFVNKILVSATNFLVIDADALNAISRNTALLSRSKARMILTPHPGEMSRLTGMGTRNIEKNRKTVAKNFARKFNCVLVLKGHGTVVASPTGRVFTNSTGNPGMATAGSGDVLTGMIAALAGQGLDDFTAAKLGVILHGQAGDMAAKKKTRAGMIAADMIDCIPQALKIHGAS